MVEFLWDSRLLDGDNAGLHRMVEEAITGDVSMRVLSERTDEIGPTEAAIALAHQASDPGFLLGDHDELVEAINNDTTLPYKL